MKTYTVKAGEIQKRWFVVDANGRMLGRLATEVAKILRGKHKPTFSTHLDTGDFVIIINAEKVRVSGNKLAAKRYYHHSGYLGGLKETVLSDQLVQHPDRVLGHAIRGMLPRNRLGRQMLKKLKVYAGDKHPHAAQKPETLDL